MANKNATPRPLRIFVSHGEHDQKIADHFINTLVRETESTGTRIYFLDHKTDTPADVEDQDLFIIIASPTYLSSSKGSWEWEAILKEQAQYDQPILSILTEKISVEDSPLGQTELLLNEQSIRDIGSEEQAFELAVDQIMRYLPEERIEPIENTEIPHSEIEQAIHPTFSVGFQIGSIFQPTADLIVIPISDTGTTGTLSIKRLKDWGISYFAPTGMMGDTYIDVYNTSFDQQKAIAFGMSVGEVTTSSEIIEKIMTEVAQYLNNNSYNFAINKITVPLLGTGNRGQLPKRKSIEAIVRGFQKGLDFETNVHLDIYLSSEEDLTLESVLRQIAKSTHATFVPYTKNVKVSGYTTDDVNEVGEDKLDIQDDVDAFAYLISKKDLEPPLSIGLFGDWGSGKSFFMKRLEKKVNQIIDEEVQSAGNDFAEPGNNENQVLFCKDIVQIKFNAWHYIDANLWACLVGSIFEKMGSFIGYQSEEEKKEEQLLMEYDVAIGKLAKAQADLKRLQKEKEKKKIQIEQEQKSDKEKKKELADLAESTKQKIAEAEKRESEAREAYDQINKELQSLTEENEVHRKQLYSKLASTNDMIQKAKEARFEAEQEEHHLKDQLEELNKKLEIKQKELVQFSANYIGEQIKNSEAYVALRKEMKTNLNFDVNNKSAMQIEAFLSNIERTHHRGNGLFHYLGSLSAFEKVFFLLLLITVPVVTLLLTKLSGWDLLKEQTLLVGTTLTAATASLMKFVNFGKSSLEKVNALFGKIEATKTQLETFRNTELVKLQKEYDQILKQINAAKVKENQLKIEVNELNLEIEEIQKGKRLTGYIEKRLGSNDYQQYLGLISMIRNDFEKMSRLLQKAAEKSKHKGIERIILYIDDLDRCPPEKVVDVLQAIHLILAFPLFVVVVAVDVRWISKSLIRRYGLMISPYNTTGEKTELTAFYRDGATPFAYMEKIFQIPFRLEPLSSNSKISYIEDLLEGDLKNTETGEAIRDSSPNQEPSRNVEIQEKITSKEREETASEKSKSSLPPTSSPQNKTQEEYFVRPNTERLLISQAEFSFIKKIIPIIGDSPRSVKRFINVYRLIKANEKWNKWKNLGDQRAEGILVLLGIVVGAPSLSIVFFETLRKSPSPNLTQLVSSLILPPEMEEYERAIFEHEMLMTYFNSGETDAIEVGDLSLDTLQQLAPLVTRFSFRVSGN